MIEREKERKKERKSEGRVQGRERDIFWRDISNF